MPERGLEERMEVIVPRAKLKRFQQQDRIMQEKRKQEREQRQRDRKGKGDGATTA